MVTTRLNLILALAAHYYDRSAFMANRAQVAYFRGDEARAHRLEKQSHTYLRAAARARKQIEAGACVEIAVEVRHG